MQLQRDVLPAFENAGVKLFVVGIGSVESGREFSEALRPPFPLEMLLVDESELTDAYAAAGTRNSARGEDGKQVFEGVESMWSTATTTAIDARGKQDLDAVTGNLFNKGPYKPLMPKGRSLFDQRAIEKTLVQGGSFVFRGRETLVEHYDESSGAHLPIQTLLDAALPKVAALQQPSIDSR
uniref:Uncharacterized protein n=1 Tax=Octactis speculum TaxID=3111310 RepID=A0A7S2BHG2_9STRA|mmetsp:Transcript_23353/g.31930  ORF Transcript_23353/g.31930 Transcript_23353/m.31930 type:complete len:181 (+) Transcript_23353:455-997(+)|eukprot:CAMPEP_0185778282 /NCGR_PEP_ID=MMETSP1174-20130828/92068_1 /TAXON_ID=35687 /ORGANISM="Dictyocha speculum, Strain CCMP1381" /LENGTH=180 /DNA_ID=CAMNT_0028466933 /DNA_START=455 /DNA_END=997 /DNA_ORIENTATION=+